MVCSASVLRCVVVFVVVATLEASDWLVFCSCKPSLALLLSFVIFYIVILFRFSTFFFDNITFCTNLQNVTLSNMSHLVYITLCGETDGVILSRLDCMTDESPRPKISFPPGVLCTRVSLVSC